MVHNSLDGSFVELLLSFKLSLSELLLNLFDVCRLAGCLDHCFFHLLGDKWWELVELGAKLGKLGVV